MFNIEEIYEPNSKTQLINYINEINNPTIIAGGTDVLIKLRHGTLKDVNLVSIRNIEDLKRIKLLKNGDISIGSMSTFSDIFRNEVINENIPVLAEAAVSMGGPQIRNMATIGGNICNGAVSADSAPALFALNALLKIESSKGERLVPIQNFYYGPGKVHINSNELLTEIIISSDNYKNKKGNYIKFANRKAMDISMLGVAVVGEFSDNKIIDIRISLGVAAPTPIRCKDAEIFATDKEISDDLLSTIGKLAVNSSNARNSWRGSKAFREHLIQNLTIRAIKNIFNAK